MWAEVLNKPNVKSLLISTFIFTLIYGLITLLSSIIVPLVTSLVIYTFLHPYSNYLLRKNIPQTGTILIPLLSLIFIIVVGIIFLIPEITEQFTRLQNQSTEISKSFLNIANKIEDKIENVTSFTFDNKAQFLPNIEELQNQLKPVLINISQYLVNFSVILLLVPIFSFFLLKDFKNARNSMLNLLPNKYFELGWLIYYRVSKQLQVYLSGIMTQSFIMAVVSSFGFFIVGIESALLLGFLAGILNLIPYIGPLMAMVGPVLIALAQYPGDLQMILVAISVIIAAQLFDNIIVIPSVIANSVNLHPMIVICGVIIFGGLFGLMGMVVAIPVLASAKILFVELNHGLKTHNA